MPHRHAVVWLDHAEARVFEMNAASAELKVVHAHADVHGTAHGSPRVHHKASVIGSGKVQDEPAYFGQVAAELEGSTEILLLGPGVAKQEFVRHLQVRIPSVARRIVRVETADRMTDNQIVAHARAFFTRADRMQPQLAPQGD